MNYFAETLLERNIFYLEIYKNYDILVIIFQLTVGYL